MAENIQFEKPEVFAVKHQDDSERMLSQSGGMFALLSDYILENGGIIYGCAFDESFKAVHTRACDRESRDLMRGSKYVQSDMGDVFTGVLADLKAGRTVLFSGTSCQVAGLRSFLKTSSLENTDNLFTADIVCHGVPSPLVWRDYLTWEAGRKNSRIKSVICRDKKKYGWNSHVTTLRFTNGKAVSSKTFPNIFYSHVALRPACYKCPYKDIIHPADITIADYWGIDKALPGFGDRKGVSLVLINNAAGRKLFDACADKMFYESTKIEDSMQKPLIGPYDPPAGRSRFWSDYAAMPFGRIAEKYGNYSLYKELNWKVKVFIKKKIHG